MSRRKSLPRSVRSDGDGFAVATATHITNQRLTCVAVKIDDAGVQVRDTKDASRMTLSFSKEEWAKFIEGVKEGEFEL